VRIDEGRLSDLIVESQDLQSDAMRDMASTMDDLEDIREERRRDGVNLDEIARYNASRRNVLAGSGLGLGSFAFRGLLGGGIGAALVALVSSPAAADKSLDIQILQTAASLENLAVGTYKTALTLPYIANGNATVKAFAEKTMMQHAEHGSAFNAQARKLGGREQSEANPKYNKVVTDAVPGLMKGGPADVVKLATALEQVATQTYLKNLTLLDDSPTKALMASVMGVEAQHLATLRAVGALLGADKAELIAIPTKPAELPKAAGSVAFPKPFEGTENAEPPESGAVK
jgi:hypothetical protein